MKAFFLSLLFICFSPAGAKPILLSPGERIRLPLPPDQTIRIGEKSLVLIQKEGLYFSLLARKEGRTRLTTGPQNYEIFIFSKEKKGQVLKLEQLLKNFWGMSWSLSEKGELEVGGRLNRLSDWLELKDISEKHKIPYLFKAHPGEGLEKTIQYYFKSLFPDKPAPEIIWSQLPLVNVPQGLSLPDYKNKLKAFGLIPQEKALWSPLIEIEIALVESSKSSSFSFGGQPGSEKAFAFSSLLGFLNFLKNSGKGKALHHSSLTAQSGQKLNIQSGGQIPFQSYNLKTEQQNTEWKPYGLSLSVLPTIRKKGQIELDIHTQISEPLSLTSAHKAPPLKTQSWQGKMIVNQNQIISLFQLKKQSQGGERRGQLGFLPKLPISFLNGNSRRQMIQTLFIQAKISSEKEQSVKKEFKMEDL